MADARPQPIPGTTLNSAALDFWYSMPADVQAAILASKNPKDFGGLVHALNFEGIKTWADLKANQASRLGPFDFYGIPILQQGAQTVNTVTGAATTVGDFLGRLSDPHMWTRILLVAIGGTLVVAALAKLAGTSVPSPVSLIKKVAK